MGWVSKIWEKGEESKVGRERLVKGRVRMMGMGWVSKVDEKREEGCAGRGVWDGFVRREVRMDGNGESME